MAIFVTDVIVVLASIISGSKKKKKKKNMSITILNKHHEFYTLTIAFPPQIHRYLINAK